MATTLDIHPIAGALGAEISGVNLSDDLSNAQFEGIHQAFLDHHVIFFRDQKDLSPDAQQRFARRFGLGLLARLLDVAGLDRAGTHHRAFGA